MIGCSKETRLKLSIAMKGKWAGEKNPFFGKRHSPETREKMSEALRGSRNPNYGKRFPEETIRIMAEAQKGKWDGEKNPNWHGGMSPESHGPEFNAALKDRVRARDKHRCQICQKRTRGRKFDVHHISYGKKDNRPENLITLCHPCHMLTNHNRERWQAYFAALI
jgi:hypothetical protein